MNVIEKNMGVTAKADIQNFDLVPKGFQPFPLVFVREKDV